MDRSVATIAVIYMALALGLLWLSAPQGLVGLTLERDLGIAAGSTMPSPSLQPGDRIVAANGQPVTSPRELAAVIARLPGAETTVTIERRNRFRTATLSELRFDTDPPEELLRAHRIVSVDDVAVPANLAPTELGTYLRAAAPTPIVVSYELARTPIAGRIGVTSRSHSPLVLAWLGLGILVMLATAVFATQRLTRQPLTAHLVRGAGGGLALAALTAVVAANDAPPPTFALVAMAAFALWRGASMSVGEGQTRAMFMLPAAVLAAGLVVAGVTAVGQETVGGWLTHVSQASMAGLIIGCAYLVLEVFRLRQQGGWRFHVVAAGVVVGLVAAVALAVGFGVASDVAGAWALLIGGACCWVVEAHQGFDGGASSNTRSYVSVDTSEGIGLEAALVAIERQLPEGVHVEAIGGVDEHFVRVSRVDRGAHHDLATRVADDEMAAGFGMLALEGGMYPRHVRMHGSDVVDDPFVDFSERLGLVAVIPYGAKGAGVPTFIAVVQDELGGNTALDLEAIIQAVASTESPRATHELVALVSQSLLRAARRGAAQLQPAPPAPRAEQHAAPVPAETPDDGTLAAAEAWAHQLGDELKRGYPVQDPDALNDREWLALGFLRDSIKPALLVGEPGVGKEFVARAVHDAMWGETRRFAVLDCAVRPPSIVEVELFGDEETPGLVELVGRGTLLIKSASNLGDNRLETLVARLDRSEARVVFAERYVGDETGVPKTVSRVIRNVVQDRNIHLSPLRDRPADIVRYARYFLHRAGMTYDVMVTSFMPEAEAWLRALELPGNFPELRARVVAGVLRAEDESVSLRDLGVDEDSVTTDDIAPTTAETKRETSSDDGAQWTTDERRERDKIVDALTAHDGNRTHAAASLDMSRGALLRRMRKYDID